ncbi:MAG: MFS transporter [Thermomicrobiales bacterium]|nr:MFS transporter [Thermomicrobiales bacterium]
MKDPLTPSKPESSRPRRVLRRIDRHGREIDWQRNLYAIWLAQFLAILGFSLRAPFLPFFLEDLGADTPSSVALWSGMINAAGAGVMVIAAPMWGAVADRRGRRPMLVRAMFFATFTVGLMGFATAPWQLLGLRLVEGATTGTVVAATALVASTTPRDKLGYSLGLIQMSIFSGSAIGPLIGGVLGDAIGYRPTFFAAGGMLFAGCLIVFFVVRENFTPVERKDAPSGLRAFRAAGSWMFVGVMGSMVLILFASRFASSAVQPIVPIFIGQLHDSVLGLSASATSGLALGMLGLTSAISSIYFGRLGDRRGHQSILLICAFASALIYLPMGLATSSWQLVILQGLFGIAAGGLVPAANAIIADKTSPDQRGTVFGFTASAASLGGFFGPLAGAGIAAWIGFSAAFVITGIFLLIVSLIIWRSFRNQPVAASAA